jgi:hypothetical protein
MNRVASSPAAARSPSKSDPRRPRIAASLARSAGVSSNRAAFIGTTPETKLARQQAIEGGGINPPPACYADGQPRNTPAPGIHALA